MRDRLLAGGAITGSARVWDIARIEAGRPEWGIDMNDSTIPQEANFDELGAISYTKGCYVGQEVVARVHFAGTSTAFCAASISSARRFRRPTPSFWTMPAA